MNVIMASNAFRVIRATNRFKASGFRIRILTAQFSTEKEKQEKVPSPVVPKARNTNQPNNEEAIKSEDFVDDSEIQPEWLSLEKRLAFRKPKRKGEGPEGRSPLRGSAWDAEHV